MRRKRERNHGVGPLLLLVGLAAWLLLWNELAQARGVSHGLHWGYHPPAGNPLTNIWRFASPWSAMNGGGIMHHNLGPAQLNQQVTSPSANSHLSSGMRSSQGSHGSYGTFHGSGSVNRSTMFPGSSSQPTAIRSVPAGRGYAPRYVASSPVVGSYESVAPYVPPYYHTYNGYWLHGYWGGGLSGWSHWDAELGPWAFPRWGLGPLYYSSGYGSYGNPFVSDQPGSDAYRAVIDLEESDSSTVAGGDAGQALPGEAAAREPLAAGVLKSPAVTAGLKAFDAARDAFLKKDFTLALRKVDDALQSLPNDPALHEFRALVLFAQREYRQAAAAIYAVLAVSPGWDWTTLSGLYADHDEYTRQLRGLETYRKEHPDAPEAALLVAYHYAICGHHDVARKHMQNVARMLPDDKLSLHLATLLIDASEKPASGEAPAGTGVTEPAGAEPAETSPAAVDAKTLVGKWHSSRGADLRIDLTIQADGQFLWNVAHGGKTRQFEGSYLLAGNQLLLSCAEGTMIGVVTVRSLAGGFNFRLLENGPTEPGLDFDH